MTYRVLSIRSAVLDRLFAGMARSHGVHLRTFGSGPCPRKISQATQPSSQTAFQNG